MDISETKKRMLHETVSSVPYLIDSLCNIREDIHEIKRAEWQETVRKIRAEMESDQMLLFIGPYSSGKSTFINALLGAPLLPTASRPCTSVVMELCFAQGGGHKGKLFYYGDSEPKKSDYDTIMELVNGPKGSVGRVASIHHIELVFDVTTVDNWKMHPLARLENLGIRVVDCPGYGSPYLTKEDAIEEYIQKASFTFWMSPADKFGGRLAERKLRDIKKKTTALIPVLTMADKIDNAQREQVTEDFAEHLAPLFPKNKEPRFVSAHKYLESVELAKKLDSRKDEISREEQEKIEQEIENLKLEAGLENVYSDMIDAGEKRIVADSKIRSAIFDLNDLLKDIGSRAENEENHWKKEAEKIGWSESDEYKKLNEIKKDVDLWIKAEAKTVAGNIETSMLKKIADYIMQVKGKIDSGQVNYIVMEIWEQELNKQKDKWAEYLFKRYKEYAEKYNINFSTESNLKAPDLGSITAGFANTTLSIMEAFRYAGAQSIATGMLGAALMLSSGAVASAPLVGGLLAGLMMIAGPVFLLVAAVPLFPLIKDLKQKRDDQYRKKMEADLKEWMKNLDLVPSIQAILNKENEQLYQTYRNAFYVDVTSVIPNLESCKKIREELSAVYDRISDLFPEETKKGH